MIRSENGKVELAGNIIELSSDLIVSFAAIMGAADAEGYDKEVITVLFKPVVFTMIDCAKKHGINIELSGNDKERLQERYGDIDFEPDKHRTKGNPFTMGMSGSPLDDFLMGFGTKGE